MTIEYPATRKGEDVDELAGVRSPDPYRWLEDAKADDVRQWQGEQAKLASETVRSWPGFDALRDLVEGHTAPRFGSAPTFAGGRWFQSVTAEGDPQAGVVAADEPYGNGDTVYSPEPDGEGTTPFLSWFAPSPDGRTHGGPVWGFRNTWSMLSAWVPLLVSRGYAVLNPNPRGSGGRGQEFAGRVVGDMGGADTHDYLAGIDALVARGVADPGRVGLIGGSYGGFMSSWLVTQDRRFAAAVPISPVTDWYSQSLTSNISEWGLSFLGGDLESPGTQAQTRSPALQASSVRTPCLSVAGALDRCTPPGQAREFHHALRAHGVDSALVIYPEEGHGVRAYPAQIDFLTRALDWFERYMPSRRS